jgi:hypothetical protein
VSGGRLRRGSRGIFIVHICRAELHRTVWCKHLVPSCGRGTLCVCITTFEAVIRIGCSCLSCSIARYFVQRCELGYYEEALADAMHSRFLNTGAHNWCKAPSREEEDAVRMCERVHSPFSVSTRYGDRLSPRVNATLTNCFAALVFFFRFVCRSLTTTMHQRAFMSLFSFASLGSAHWRIPMCGL